MLLAGRLRAGLLRDGDAIVPAPHLRPLVGALGALAAVRRGALAAVERRQVPLAFGATFRAALLARQLQVLLGGEEVEDGLVLGQLQLLVDARQDPAHAALERRWPGVARLLEATAAVGVSAEEEDRGADADVGEAVSTQLAARDGDLALGVVAVGGGRQEIDHFCPGNVASGELSAPERPTERRVEVDALSLERKPAEGE